MPIIDMIDKTDKNVRISYFFYSRLVFMCVFPRIFPYILLQATSSHVYVYISVRHGPVFSSPDPGRALIYIQKLNLKTSSLKMNFWKNTQKTDLHIFINSIIYVS